MPDCAVYSQVPTEDEGEEIDIDLDVYGATIFSVIYDLSELFGGVDQDNLGMGLHVLRLSFVLLLLVSNFSLQIGMLYYIYSFVVLGLVHKAEMVYQQYHDECFYNGQFNVTLWEEWEYKDDLCGMGFANFGFMYAIISLWWLTMLNEFRKNERLLQTLIRVPGTSDVGDMVYVKDEVTTYFKKVTCGIRYGLYAILVAPKILINIGLLLIGTIWLTSTLSYDDLILNAIALEFVIQVDELLFTAMLPSFICARISQTKFLIPGKGPKSPAQFRKTFVDGYQRSYTYLSGVCLLVYLFLTYGQNLPYVGVFPGFESDLQCQEYVGSKSRRVCVPGMVCFPKA